MTFKSPQIMSEIADLYAGGLSLNNCAKKLGIAPRTLHSWLKLSRENDPSTLTVYLDEEMQFARALSIARQLLYLNMRSNFEARMLTGDETPIFFQGRPSFVELEECAGIDDPDVREMLGYPRDGILRDNRNRRVQHVLRTPAPVAGVLAALAVGYPGEWTPSSKVEQAITNRTQGVTVLTGPPGPPVVPPKPKLPELEVLADPAEVDLDDLLGPAPRRAIRG